MSHVQEAWFYTNQAGGHAYNLIRSQRQEVAQLKITLDYVLDLRSAWDKTSKRALGPYQGGRHQKPRLIGKTSCNSTPGTQGMWQWQDLSSSRVGPVAWLCRPLSWAALIHCLEIPYILWARCPLMMGHYAMYRVHT